MDEFHLLWRLLSLILLLVLQESGSITDNILLHPGRFCFLLGTSHTTHEMVVQTRSQCPSWVSCVLSTFVWANICAISFAWSFLQELVCVFLSVCRYATPFGLTSEYAHPAEILFLGFATIVGPAITGPHLMTLWLWMVLRVLETVEAHCGYHFPWSLSNFIPLYGGWVCKISLDSLVELGYFVQWFFLICSWNICFINLQCWFSWLSSSFALYQIWQLFINFCLHGLVSFWDTLFWSYVYFSCVARVPSATI